MTSSSWNKHYEGEESILLYPDENLIRMVSSYLRSRNGVTDMAAVDLGCGSGRHMKLLSERGIGRIIGIDVSPSALQLCKKYQMSLILAQNEQLPLKNESVDIAVSWGSLHYARKQDAVTMLEEIRRILKPPGILFGTLRTDRDTHLKSGKHLGDNTWITDYDSIRDTIVSFYNEDELRSLLSSFSDSRYGIMERSLIGNTKTVISHWFFWARK
jgi:ubiquinone/menaquinone biosynthesis C-methylase UbiE